MPDVGVDDRARASGGPGRGRGRRIGLALLVVTVVAATACTPKRALTGWIAYWESSGGRSAVDTNRDLFSEVSPFWYRTTGAATIVNDEDAGEAASVLAAGRAANVPIIPSVRDGTPARALAAILADRAQRAAHVNALVALAVSNGYAGVDLDYEQFAFADGASTWAATRPNWVQFIAELGAALHANAKVLTVTVPPIYDGNRTGGSGYWVYDFGGIAPHIDRLRIMAYDYSFDGAGPISPLWWVDSILAYAVTVVPPAKLQIGVPTYGRSWVTGVSGTCPLGVDLTKFDVRSDRANELILQKHAAPVRDAASGEMTFSYTDGFTGAPPPPAPTTSPPTSSTTVVPPPTTGMVVGQAAPVTCQVTRTVFFPDVTAVLDRAHLVGKYGIAGMSQWALGYEDPAQWQALSDYFGTLPHPPGDDPTGHVDGVIPGTRQVVVAGWALDPEADLPSIVAVTVGGNRTSVLARDNRPDLASQYYGTGPYHGFLATVAAPPGVQKVCVEAQGVGKGADRVSLGCTTITVAG